MFAKIMTFKPVCMSVQQVGVLWLKVVNCTTIPANSVTCLILFLAYVQPHAENRMHFQPQAENRLLINFKFF